MAEPDQASGTGQINTSPKESSGKSSWSPSKSQDSDKMTEPTMERGQAPTGTEAQEPSWLYDTVATMFFVVFSIFFRLIKLRGIHRVPQSGPVIFVGAPHSNQFVDPMMIIIAVRRKLARRVSYLIAEKSYKQAVIGGLARDMRAIPVGRAQDNLRPGAGEITTDGIKVTGHGTGFLKECREGMTLSVLGELASIARVVSDTELELSRPFKPSVDASTNVKPHSFKVAAKVDNSRVFKRVFQHLAGGHWLGIFPEGGSHDRTTLLPLKPGVAIMALGAMAEYPGTNVAIVPVGMNYFTPHKFRSRAVIEFGEPFYVDPELVKEYREGGPEGKKSSTKTLLSQIADALELVTIQAPDYETLMVVQACQRLYRPHRHIPLGLVVEFTRRFVRGYQHYKEDPRIQALYKSVQDYNKRLADMGLRDHQVDVARRSKIQILRRLVARLIALVFCAAASIPGLVISAPVLIATKWYASVKAREALRGSTVKIQARDVMATWKILMGMLWTPLLYAGYSVMVCYYVFSRGMVSSFSWTAFLGIFYGSLAVLATVSFATLYTADAGLDLFRSLTPLYLALSPFHTDTLDSLRQQRAELVVKITDIVNELGPELFGDITDRLDEIYASRVDPDADPRTDLRGLHSSINLKGDYDLAKVPVFSEHAGVSGTPRGGTPSTGTPKFGTPAWGGSPIQRDGDTGSEEEQDQVQSRSSGILSFEATRRK